MSEVLGRANAATPKDAHLWLRDELDWYVEPEGTTAALLAVESFSGDVHDPCCGGGNIVRACRAAGLTVTGSDKVVRFGERPPWHFGERDFLAEPTRADNIIMNPPFFRAKGAEAFIRQALKVARRKVAAFVDVKFLAGSARANGLYSEFPPSRVWIITPRPSCPPGAYLAAGNIAGGGTADWIWIVWDLADSSGETRFGWITNCDRSPHPNTQEGER